MAFLGFELVLRVLWGFGLLGIFIGVVKIETPAPAFVSGRRRRLRRALLGILPSVFVAILGFFKMEATGLPYALNFLTSSFLLGAVLAARFFKDRLPFSKFGKLILIALSIKTVEVVVTLATRALMGAVPSIDAMGRPLGEDITNTDYLLKLNPGNSLLSLEGDLMFKLGIYGLVLVSFRVVWGILVPWVLAVMMRADVKGETDGRLTRFLDAACLMVLVGEAVAIYLRTTLHLII